MKLAFHIAAHGVKVTFVNSVFRHQHIMASLPKKAEVQSLISLVLLPDGLEVDDDRTDKVKASVGHLEVAQKLGNEAVAFFPAGGASMALALQVPQLLEAGIIDNDGIVLKDEPISVSNDVPGWSSSEIGWRSTNPEMQKLLLGLYSIVPKYAKYYNWILCNSVYELDSSARNWLPTFCPLAHYSQLTIWILLLGTFGLKTQHA
ncbi:hypothetical protein PTKIN_Ptkin04bG0061200 [Pterospermum kingtungense]